MYLAGSGGSGNPLWLIFDTFKSEVLLLQALTAIDLV
jgi:hypothetical protein